MNVRLRSKKILHLHVKKILRKTFLLLVCIAPFFYGIAGARFTYPLPEISKPACRTLTRNQLPQDCKIKLPRIKGGNYNAYATNLLYRFVYSVLRGGTYENGRNVRHGSHPGVDIVTSIGTPVVSIGDGIVTDVGNRGGRGYYVVIRHYLPKAENAKTTENTHSTTIQHTSGNQSSMHQNVNHTEVYSIYAHLGHTLVQVGQKVSLGQVIGSVGESGKTTGPHLHFQVDRANAPHHPYWYGNCQVKYKQDLWSLVNNGYCRDEMQKWTIDPIFFIESQGESLGNPSYDIAAAREIGNADLFSYEVDSFLSYRDLTYTIHSRKLANQEGLESTPKAYSSAKNLSGMNEFFTGTQEEREKKQETDSSSSVPFLIHLPSFSENFLLSPYTITLLSITRKQVVLESKILLPQELTITVDDPTVLEVYPKTIRYIGAFRNVYLIPKVFSGTTILSLHIGKKEVYKARIYIGEPPYPIQVVTTGNITCNNVSKATICTILLFNAAKEPISHPFWTGSVYVKGNKYFFVPQTVQEYIRALQGKIPQKKYTKECTLRQRDLLFPGKIILLGKKGLKLQLHINSTEPTGD